jgi:16S rRNA processing protein RimM
MDKNNYIKVAKIIVSHGIRGEFKIKFSEDFKQIFIQNPKIGFFINSKDAIFDRMNLKFSSIKQNSCVGSSSNICSRNESDELKGHDIFCLKSELPSLSEDEFYYSDLKNMEVLVDGEVYGIISAVLNFGAGDIIEVKKTDGEIIMLPFKKDIFISITNDKVVAKLPNFT